MSGNTPWTPERVSTLRLLKVNGLSHKQIAERLGGVSAKAVTNKLRRLEGVDIEPRKAWTVDEERWIARLWNAGNDLQTIAQIVGRSIEGVATRLRQMRGRVYLATAKPKSAANGSLEAKYNRLRRAMVSHDGARMRLGLTKDEAEYLRCLFATSARSEPEGADTARDDEHVLRCIAAGGFPAIAEDHRGRLIAAITWPSARAA